MADIKEMIDKMGPSDLLTEEVKLEMAAQFEAAINEAAKAKEDEIEERNKAEIAEFKAGLTEQLDSYLSYVVDQIVEENAGLIEDVAKVRVATKILEAFEKFAADVDEVDPEEEDEETEKGKKKKKDEEEKEELKDSLNRMVASLKEKEEEIARMKKNFIILEKAEEIEDELTAEKFAKMAKSIDFVSEEKFCEALDSMVSTLRETKASPVEEFEDEEKELAEEQEPVRTMSESMRKYISRL